MRQTRPPFPPILAALVALAAFVAGCGSSDSSGPEATGARERAPTATATTPAAPPGASARTCEDTIAGTGELRVTGIGCDAGRGVVAGWASKPACFPRKGASRFSCAVAGDYRCLGAATERGFAISCARPGSSVAFVAKRG